jgi:hypothetical protein
MFLTNKCNIKEVLLFPAMKPEQDISKVTSGVAALSLPPAAP